MKKRTLRGVRHDMPTKTSQARLAKTVAGILKRSFSPARYWQIENGLGSDPSDEEKAAVAAALGVKVSDIAWPGKAKAAA
jgi:DNA-binding XRE family transcriptional regulator